LTCYIPSEQEVLSGGLEKEVVLGDEFYREILTFSIEL
jgi:hypothetical protein